MAVYDLAHQLARALCQSDEYDKFVAAKQKIMADEGNKKMINDFQLKQMEIQQAQLLQEGISTETQQELEQLYSLLSLNPSTREYIEAEFHFSRLVNDVQKIIGDAIHEAMPVGYDEND